MSARGRSGVLVADKPAGVTSFDVVALVRRRLGLRRVGHAGTLDPDAVGVLPVLLGEATKLVPYLMDHDKAYRATLRLGVSTDTHDLTGKVIARSPSDNVTLDDLRCQARGLVGRIQQVPPMFSALHHEGRRLYELARIGIEVDRRPREVVVHSLDVEALEGQTATVHIVCGKGTYVRVLAADLGARLGCGAAVERLIRTRVGPFERVCAVGWTELTDSSSEALWARVLPAASVLAGWPAVHLDARASAAFSNGQTADVPAGTPRGLVRVHDLEGRLLGVGDASANARVRPLRILHADRPGSRVLPV
jgi:tRNA pseudouridine55 synthase